MIVIFDVFFLVRLNFGVNDESPVARKPVFGVSDQVQHKSGSEHPQKMTRDLESSDLERKL